MLRQLLPMMRDSYSWEALDEIIVFWLRRIEIVNLYLGAFFSSIESFAFTGSTFMDFEDGEHLPFLLMGKQHVFDDPLSRYAEFIRVVPEGNDATYIYEQICKTAEDNIKILEHLKGEILILPLRMLRNDEDNKLFFEMGERVFVSLFDGINSFNEYFEKCTTLEDIISYGHTGFENVVMLYENDERSQPFKERFEIAISNNHYVIDPNKSDAFNFFVLVYGNIQQAISILYMSLEYGFIPYVRYSLIMNYLLLLGHNLKHMDQVSSFCYMLCIASTVHKNIDKNKLRVIPLNIYSKLVKEYDFRYKLFYALSQHGINEENYPLEAVLPVVKEEFNKLYTFLSANCQ